MSLFLLIQDQAVEPWFSDPDAFGALAGGLGGGLGGVFMGLLGAAAGMLAPRGVARRLVLGLMMAVALVGVGLLVTGVVGVVQGQPYAIWFPFVLIGFIASVVCGSLVPVVRKRYEEAEARRIDAAGV